MIRNVTYKKHEFPDRGRVISIRENSADKECATRVMKNFVYLVSRADEIPQNVPSPEIRMTKKVAEEGRCETFIFKVKGAIFVKEKRFIYRVDYSHGLTVHMNWKNHVLSSKPVTLA